MYVKCSQSYASLKSIQSSSQWCPTPNSHPVSINKYIKQDPTRCSLPLTLIPSSMRATETQYNVSPEILYIKYCRLLYYNIPIYCRLLYCNIPMYCRLLYCNIPMYCIRRPADTSSLYATRYNVAKIIWTESVLKLR